MAWRAPPFAEDRLHHHILIPSMDRPAQSGAQPGAWEWRPPRGLAKNARVSVMVWEGLKFSFCCKFESVYDKNFTNQSAPILSLSFSPPRGGYNSQTTAPPAPFDAVAVDDIIHRLSPTDWRGVGAPEWPARLCNGEGAGDVVVPWCLLILLFYRFVFIYS